MTYDDAKRHAKNFNKRFTDHNVVKSKMSDSIDMEIWDKDGFMCIKNSKRIETDNPKEFVYEADIHGDITKLEAAVCDDIGRKVTIQPRSKTVIE